MGAESVQVVILLPDHTPPEARAHPTFAYDVPAGLSDKLRPGHLVLVPFGRHAAAQERLVSGVIFSVGQVAPQSVSYGGSLKPIHDLLDPQPVVSETHLRLAQWMADYYLAPLCECVRLFVPPGQTVHSDLEYALTVTNELLQPATSNQQPVKRLGSVQAAIIARLRERGPLRAGQLDVALRGKNWQAAIKPLVAQGLITVRRILPRPRTRPNMVRVVELVAGLPDDISLGKSPDAITRRRRALDFMQREGRPVQVEWVYAESGCTAADLKFLQEKGLIAIRLQPVLRDPLADKTFVPVTPPPLTADQSAAWQRLSPSLSLSPSPSLYLLHGVTGSGKTELYLRAVAQTLQAGRQAIVLVPEISLTPQTIRRFAARFPGRVAVWHSQMSTDERYDTWQRIRAGLADVVIGPRSALFVPLARLGLIVIDEEHESSYKQDVLSDLPFETPPYHAREVALELARLTGSAVIMGSATPSLEAFLRAERGEFELLTLSRRILSHSQYLQEQQQRFGVEPRYQPLESPETRFIDLPPVQVVDMRQELREGHRHIFSRALQAALKEVLDNRQQAILFLNRRGSATFVLCRDCGHVMTCPRCDIPLTYHEEWKVEGGKWKVEGGRGKVETPRNTQSPIPSTQSALLCHLCNHSEPNPVRCPACGSRRIKYFGLGTQGVEKAVNELFSQARVLRWDADTALGSGAHELFLQQFIEGQANVMVGTQMIAKGLDLPMVTLVGVISADVNLRLPDFRAAERTFQLLAQVAGRAGRGLLGGRVIVQTFAPDHYAIQHAARHDYTGFAQQELMFRFQMDYPPFTRLARLVVRQADLRRAEREAEKMANLLLPRLEAHGLDSSALIGPAPCFFGRVRDEYRWQLILRAPDPAAILRNVPLSPAWRVDIDPVALL